MSVERRGGIPEDEVDFGRLGRSIWSAITYPFRLFRKHPVITVSFVLLAVALAVVGKYSIGRLYSASFIIKPIDRNERFHLNMLHDLETLRKQSDHAALARMLRVSESVTKGIAKIGAHNPFISNRSDSINYTVVTLMTASPDYLLPVQEGILNYLEENPYFHKIRLLQENQIAFQRKVVEEDLRQLDSLKKMQLVPFAQGSGTQPFILENLVDKSKIYSASAERMQRKNSLLAQEQFLQNFQLVKPLIVPSIHSWPPRILVMLLYAIPAALVLCFLLLAVIDSRRA